MGRSMNAYAARGPYASAPLGSHPGTTSQATAQKQLRRRIGSLNAEYRQLLREGASNTDAGVERLAELVELIEDAEKQLRELFA